MRETAERFTLAARMSRRAHIVAVLGASLVVVAPAGAAPTLSADRACYAAAREAMDISGSGYTPGGEVALLFASEMAVERASVTAGPDGNFSLRQPAPTLAAFGALSPGFTLSITASDRARQGATPSEPSVAATSVIVSEWSVDVAAWNASAYATPRKRTTVSAYGWTTLGPTLYAHFVRAGRLLRSVEVGSLSGPCGSLTRRTREFPFRPVPAGRYRVQFDTSKTYRGTRARNYVVYRRVKVHPRDAVR